MLWYLCTFKIICIDVALKPLFIWLNNFSAVFFLLLSYVFQAQKIWFIYARCVFFWSVTLFFFMSMRFAPVFFYTVIQSHSYKWIAIQIGFIWEWNISKELKHYAAVLNGWPLFYSGFSRITRLLNAIDADVISKFKKCKLCDVFWLKLGCLVWNILVFGLVWNIRHHLKKVEMFIWKVLFKSVFHRKLRNFDHLCFGSRDHFFLFFFFLLLHHYSI